MFKLNIIEGIKNINKNRVITYMSVILFTLLFLLQSYTYSYYVVNELQKESMEHETVKNYKIYGLSSRYPYQMIKNSIEPEMFVNMKIEAAEFYETLDNAQYVKYCNLNYGGVQIDNFKGDPLIFKFQDINDSEFSVCCLYTSPNFHKVENYRVIKGRDFTDEDMVFVEGKPRAVLLGYKYIGVYEVGDNLDKTIENLFFC